MRGIDAVQSSPLAPAKITPFSSRLQRNEVKPSQPLPRHRGVIMRFIEFMPLDATVTGRAN